MTYVYAAMWFVVGFLLIFRMAKENRIFYLAGAFFLLLGGWWLADALLPVNLFAGGYGWVLRGLTAAALVFVCAAFFRENRKSKEEANQAKKKE